MEVSEAIESRRSIRRYKDKPVSDELIKEILKAGEHAPSAGNLQSRDFIIIKDGAVRELLCMAALNQYFIMGAPVCVVVCANTGRCSVRYGKRSELYAVQDASASVMNMMLKAVDLGLGTCWVGAFNELAVIQLFDIPHGVRPVALLSIGYPDESPEAPPNLGEATEHWGQW